MQIRPLDPDNALAAGNLFEALGDQSHFHPHDLSIDHAIKLASEPSNNIYAIAMVRWEHAAISYGLLRGWDQGYAIPSLGVAVHPRFRGSGLGRAMMGYLHCVAKLRGAKQIRLKVYPDNAAAIRLYESLGYAWNELREDDQLVGIVNL